MSQERVRGREGDAIYQAFMLAGCGLVAAIAARVLATGAPITARLHASTPGGDWIVGVDALSAVFLLAVAFVGVACAVFGVQDESAREAQARAASTGPAHSRSASRGMFAALIGSIMLVVVARTILVFLGAWEVMAITSYLLIVTYHDDADVRRAGLIFLVATHTATLALMAMFAIWQSGIGPGPADWSFDALAWAAPLLTRGSMTAVLLLALAGFGFKAGLTPLHFWLPPAHSAAPSHVSAIMSGIVIKTGIYGLLRVLMLMSGTAVPDWFGWLILLLGIASSLLGVLWALAQHDIKRLLAYHSVENIGIILMGMGVGVIGVAHRRPTIAVLGFGGALLHTVNHSLFKSLLFLGAGSVYRATGTRNLDELGGLGRRMPITWLAFGIGAAAIVGLPPLNGFVSEWLVYQGLFLPGESGETIRFVILGVPALALTGGLALACFAKVSGVVFLGTPRSARVENAAEGPRGTWLPMLAIAGACLLLGLVPAAGVSLVRAASRDLTGAMRAEIPLAVVSATVALSITATLFIAACALLWWLRSFLLREYRGGVRYAQTWGCGYDAATPRMQYTASSFAAPVLGVFGRLSGVQTERATQDGVVTVHTRALDIVLDGLVLPCWNGLSRAALRLRGIQHGRIHIYLVYVLAAVLALLAYLSMSARA